MKPRERWIIGAGAAVVALILFFRGGNRDSISPTSGASSSLGSSLAQIENFDTARRSVKKLTSDLAVTIPQEPPSEQEVALRTQLTQFVQQNGMALANLRRADAGGPRSATLKPVQFSLELNGPFASLMNLIYALEHAPMPFLVQEMSVTSAAAGGQQAPGAGAPSPGGSSMPPGGGSPGSMPRMPRSPGAMPRGMGSGAPSSPSPNPSPGGGAPSDPKQADKVHCSLLVQTHIFPAPAGTAQRSTAAPAAPNQATSSSQQTPRDSAIQSPSISPEKRK